MEKASSIIQSFCEKHGVDTWAFHVIEDRQKVFSSYQNAEKNSVFGIGSVSKAIDKIAILSLVEEGKLKLSDSLFDFGFDEVQDGINLVNYLDWYGWDEITIEHCLRHTSGIPDHMNEIPEFNYHYGEYGKLEDPDTLTVLRSVAKYPLHFKAGQDERYSNTNFYLLCKVIENVTGKAYGEAIDDIIFKKAGMKNTHWAYSTTNPKGLVQSYVLDQGSNALIDKFSIKPFDAWAIFYSSPKDMMMLADSYLNDRLISKETRDSFFESDSVGQMGAIHDGFQCYWDAHPKSGVSYVFMINVFGQTLLDPFIETTEEVLDSLGFPL